MRPATSVSWEVQSACGPGFCLKSPFPVGGEAWVRARAARFCEIDPHPSPLPERERESSDGTGGNSIIRPAGRIVAVIQRSRVRLLLNRLERISLAILWMPRRRGCERGSGREIWRRNRGNHGDDVAIGAARSAAPTIL